METIKVRICRRKGRANPVTRYVVPDTGISLFDGGIIPRDGFYQNWKGKKAKAVANQLLQQSDESEPLDLAPKTVCGKAPVPEGGPREMTREDNANVEFVRASASIDCSTH